MSYSNTFQNYGSPSSQATVPAAAAGTMDQPHLVSLVLQSKKALQHGEQLCTEAHSASHASAQAAVDVLALDAKVRWISEAVVEQLKVSTHCSYLRVQLLTCLQLAASVAKTIEEKRDNLGKQVHVKIFPLKALFGMLTAFRRNGTRRGRNGQTLSTPFWSRWARRWFLPSSTRPPSTRRSLAASTRLTSYTRRPVPRSTREIQPTPPQARVGTAPSTTAVPPSVGVHLRHLYRPQPLSGETVQSRDIRTNSNTKTERAGRPYATLWTTRLSMTC